MDEKELEEKYGNPNVKIVFDEEGIPCILLDEPVHQARRNPNIKFSNLMNQKQKYLKMVHNELRKRNRPSPIFPFDIFIIEFGGVNEDEDESRGNEDR